MANRNPRRKRRNRLTPSVHRVLQSERLESRQLLAGDIASSWQNPIDPNDVDQNSLVTWKDALNVVRSLNHDGARRLPERAAGEPGDVVALVDTDGDGFLTPGDALQVINQLNGEGEGEIVGYLLEVTDTSGNPITTANVGDQVRLRGYIQDLRDATEADGIFSGYVDVEYDASLVSVATSGAVTFGDDFPNGRFADTSVPGIINEVGGFVDSFSGAGTDEMLLFTVAMEASEAGSVTFSSNAADTVPIRETLFFGSDEPIAAEDIDFGTTSLTIVDTEAGSPDLVAFAKALGDAGVQFWSTRGFSVESVQQRALFEDGADLLPLNETLDASGSINDAATAANVGQVNTWVFPDQTRSDGSVLSLEQISQRSGVPIPTGSTPFLHEIPDVTSLTDESPLHIPLDGYDPESGPLTYTVTTDNPDLLTTRLLEGNRSWLLDVAGYGRMVFEFFEQRASRATERFIELTEADFYNGITFHRIIDDFVIQGGDPTGTGAGSSDLPDFDDHFNVELQHNRTGVLSMAKAGDDTNNSQFFVTEGPQQHLDFNHTVFGQLIEGESTRDAISEVTGGATVVIDDASVLSNDSENATLFLQANGAGSGNVTVTVTDDQGNQSSRTFAVNASADGRNSQPFLSDIPDLAATVGTTFQFQLEYTDIENDDVFFFVDDTNPSNAVASVNESGLVSVEIPIDAAGSEITVDVAVSQSSNRFSGNRDEQRVRITVEGNSVPADEFTVDEDSTDNTLDVLANDELESDATITDVLDLGLLGTATIAADGKTILYTPAADFVGTETLSYAVDSGGEVFVGSVAITVENTIDGPTANDDEFPMDFTDEADRALLVEDSSGVILSVLANDRPDPDQEEIVLIDSVTQPEFGTAETNGFNITYIPAPDFVGTDTFTYTVEGFSTQLKSTATVTVIVPEINDPPAPAGESFTVAAGETNVFEADQLLSNDLPGPSNESDQVLTVSDFFYQGTGSVVLNSDGSLEYTPAAGFVGSETIEYTVVDNGTDNGVLTPRTATASLTLTVEAQSIVIADSFTVDFGSSDNVLDVLVNDLQQESLEIISVSPATSGNVVISGDARSLEYTAGQDFAGEDSLTYTVRNASGEEATANVTITVDSQAPTAVDDQFTFTGEISLDVLANDVRGIGATSLRVESVTQPSNGTAALSFIGAGVEYQPNDGFAGEDSFTYTVMDNTGKMSTATVTMTVEAPSNDPPLAFNDDPTVEKDGGPQSLGVLNNDTALPDTDETLTVVEILTQPQNGTAEINQASDDIVYTPNAGFEGVDNLSYRISDGNGGTATASVEISVEPQNVPPVAIDDRFDVDTFGQQMFEVLANDTGESGETLRIGGVDTTLARGVVSVNADGTQILYTPDFSMIGEDVFSYTVEDGTGLSAHGTVRVNVADLLGGSFFSGSIYTDLNNDGDRQGGERGIGGVTVVLEGTDLNGNDVRMETKTSLHGEFRFNRVAPGDYTVSEVQPDFTIDGRNNLGSQVMVEDEFPIEVNETLITADDNGFGERGLVPQLVMWNSLSSSRQPGLFVVIEDDQLAWLESRGGWDAVDTLEVTVDGDTLSISGTDQAGEAIDQTLSMKDKSLVKMLGRKGSHTFLEIAGTSQEVLSADSVDAVFGSPVAANDS